jgi:hypothetical protein
MSLAEVTNFNIKIIINLQEENIPSMDWAKVQNACASKTILKQMDKQHSRLRTKKSKMHQTSIQDAEYNNIKTNTVLRIKLVQVTVKWANFSSCFVQHFVAYGFYCGTNLKQGSKFQSCFGFKRGDAGIFMRKKRFLCITPPQIPSLRDFNRMFC